ncbi:hypothetical protein [Pseudomonas asplenii]|uniref:hypothetical protein n=1 Tax=Pseudomonas asplenii TaxID=53407 RepID=UPI00037D4CCF|nr:hypothetical protein [Pseudomonas fuscovaginae]
MGTNKMREQFEAKFPVPAGVAWKESIGMYEVVDIWKLDQAITIGKYNWLWEGWQASREAVVVEPVWPDHYDYTNSDVAGAAVLDCRTAFQKAMKAQGLKVAP